MSNLNVSRPFHAFYLSVALALAVLSGFCIYKIYWGEQIAYVDSTKLFNNYKGAEQAKREFEKRSKIWQANVDTLTADVQAAMRKYEREASGLSAKEQQMTRQLIGVKRKQLLDYQNAVQQNAQQETSKLSQTVIAQLNTFLGRYGKSHHYKMILIANQTGTIAYAREGMDITDKVLEEINKEYRNESK
jgi:outer membrane protein